MKKGKVSKHFLRIIIALSCLFIFNIITVPSSRASESLGVSPGRLYLEDLHPGYHYEQEFIISRSIPDKDTEITIENDSPDLRDWITFDVGDSTILPLGTQRFAIRAYIDIPENVEVGEYKGFIRIKIRKTDAQGQVSILPAVRIDVKLNVTSAPETGMKRETLVVIRDILLILIFIGISVFVIILVFGIIRRKNEKEVGM